MRYKKREKDIDWWCNLTGVKLRPFQKYALSLAAGDAIRRARRKYELVEEEVKRKNEVNQKLDSMQTVRRYSYF